MELTNPISDKLEQINNALKKYDSFVSSTLRETTDENMEVYDRWIDCRYEIEKCMEEILNSPAMNKTLTIRKTTGPEPDMIKHLMDCFPGSFINHNIEFIAHRRANEYFSLRNCGTELDIKCKILEQLSRGAHKTLPYASNKKNEEFHQFMLSGINEYLGTDFTTDDMELIYTYMGNGVHHDLTRQFVESNYDMLLLKEREEEPER